MAKTNSPPAPSRPGGHEAAEPPRRSILASILAVVIGGIVGVFPFASGLAVFLDPVLKKRLAAPPAGGEKPAEGGHGEAPAPLLRVATFDSVPADGTPVQVPVIADLKDIWTVEPNQPIGAVYLRRVGEKIECFNAICPHAGCFVAYSPDRKVFQCPCHTSSFEVDGKRIMPSPSPRDMDGLEVDAAKLKEGEVWVGFANYYPGKENRERKS